MAVITWLTLSTELLAILAILALVGRGLGKDLGDVSLAWGDGRLKSLAAVYAFLFATFAMGFMLECFRGSRVTSSTEEKVSTIVAPPPAFVPREDLPRPDVAWPTVMLAFVSVTGWAAGLWAGQAGWLPAWVAVPLMTVCMFLAFTPMHDAAHGSVSPKYKMLNSAVGWFSSIPFLCMFRIFRSIHLQHHRHTNNHNGSPIGYSLDPDHWAGEGPVLLLPLRWMTVFMYYLYYAVQLESWGSKVPQPARLRPIAMEVIPMLAMLAPILCLHGEGANALFILLVSFMFASMYLMYVFDYLPHRPHMIPRTENHFLATHALLPPSWLPRWALSAAMCCQDYHNIHHLFPILPFYHYPGVYNKHRSEFLSQGTRELPILLWPSRDQYFDELKTKAE